MIKKVLYTVVILVSAVLLSMMVRQGYMVMGIESIYEGCIEASLRLKNDYGEPQEAYMKRFCDFRNKVLKEEFQIEE